jgi:DNA polymerase III alpha subunit
LRDFIDTCISACGKENCYIDITAQRYQDYPYLKQSHDILMSLGQEFDITLVTSSGYCYPDPSQKTAYEIALAIKDGKRAYDPDARKIAGDNHHILSEQEVRSILQNNGFSDTMIDQLVAATGECADRCTTKITLGQALFPNFETPADILALYEQYKDILVE